MAQIDDASLYLPVGNVFAIFIVFFHEEWVLGCP